jgi:lysophospholipase L1-like esterase
VRYLIVLEGVNDLGTLTRETEVSEAQHHELVFRMIQAYQEIIDRSRAHGIKVIGGTIMPMGGSEYYHPNALNEADRQAVNAWIRAPGHFDAVIDFDKVAADPARPDRLKAEYDFGDGLHPSAAGHKAMGEAIDLKLFR